MNEREQKTIDYYDSQATSWAENHNGIAGESFWKTQMERFNQYLPKGRILEVGSGSGRDAKALLEMGYDYVGLDASSGLISIASQRNPGHKFIIAEAGAIPIARETFDGFWATAVLLHVPKENVHQALESIGSTLKTGAIGLITLTKGRGEVEDESTGRWFSYYSEEEFRDELSHCGFRTLEVQTMENESANKGDWLIFYVEKLGVDESANNI